jgi:FkbM family methyltransferase
MTRYLTFSGPAAGLQYALLMGLFRLAVTRGLYGRFARGLARLFPSGTAVWLHEDGAPPYRIALDDGYWTRFALYRAPYEPEVGAVLCAAAGATPLFCDLGANKGWWTTRAAPLFDRVIAVEASNATFAALQENAAHLPGVTLHRAAIHARSGETMTFVTPPLSHASARLEDGGAATAGDQSETVETLAIDDLVPPGTPDDGAVLIYEDHGSDTACTVSAHLLSDPGMRLYSIENGLAPMPDMATIRALKSDPYKGYNFLAAREDSPLVAAIAARFANPSRAG